MLSQFAAEHRHVVVGEAENGKEALLLLREVQPEMVLLDVSMPVMGGFAAAYELRRLAPQVLFLFISQQGDANYVEEAFRLGAGAYVLKSLLDSELGPAIEAVQNRQPYYSAPLARGPRP